MTEFLIPKTIHYCWYGGSNISELGESCMRTWRDLMPDYAVEAWTEQRLDFSVPYIEIAYRLKKFAFVADYVRFQALYEHGGLYFDTDIEAIRRFDDLLDTPLFLGFQAPTSVGCGVIGAVKGHPFLRRVLDHLDKEAASGRPSFRPIPDLVTELIADSHEPPVVFPEEYFYPYNPYSPSPVRRKPLQSNITERTHCIHQWEGTWLGGMSMRDILELKFKETLRKLQPRKRRRPLVQREATP